MVQIYFFLNAIRTVEIKLHRKVQIHFLFKRNQTVKIKRDKKSKLTRDKYKYFASHRTQILDTSLLPKKRTSRGKRELIAAHRCVGVGFFYLLRI